LKSVLILSDGRAGHFNQSIALAKHAGVRYDIIEVIPRFPGSKAISYLFDRLGFESSRLFHHTPIPENQYAALIAAGSTTYYPAKILAKRLDTKAITMMLPKGFRYRDFDVIFAPIHDNPPPMPHIIPIPANFAYIKPQKVYRPSTNKSIGIVIGGSSAKFSFDSEALRKILVQIRTLYPDHEFAVTTSPRTSRELEQCIESFEFDYKVIYSRTPINPLPDFIYSCERLFLTADSTSMISEAISAGNTYVEVIDFDTPLPSKLKHFLSSLEKSGHLHIFDGTPGTANQKIDFGKYARKAGL